jgi:hypothetical protein
VFLPVAKQGGNGSEYLIAKLKRDAPEFAERLAAGEFRSRHRKCTMVHFFTEGGSIDFSTFCCHIKW